MQRTRIKCKHTQSAKILPRSLVSKIEQKKREIEMPAAAAKGQNEWRRVRHDFQLTASLDIELDVCSVL
jgi:hypothetical protein